MKLKNNFTDRKTEAGRGKGLPCSSYHKTGEAETGRRPASVQARGFQLHLSGSVS